MPDPAAEVRSAIQRIKAAKKAYWAAPCHDNWEQLLVMEDAMDSFTLQWPAVDALINTLAPVTVKCGPCDGTGKWYDVDGILVHQCSACHGRGTVLALE